jgi:hypothetical protein
MYENWVLKRISGPMKTAVTGNQRKCKARSFIIFNILKSINRMSKPRRGDKMQTKC